MDPLTLTQESCGANIPVLLSVGGVDWTPNENLVRCRYQANEGGVDSHCVRRSKIEWVGASAFTRAQGTCNLYLGREREGTY